MIPDLKKCKSESFMFQSTDAFSAWEYRAASASKERVLPDGCRDIIVITSERGMPNVKFTAHDTQPWMAQIEAGVKISGFRLRPGSIVSERVVSAITAEPQRAPEIVSSERTHDPCVDEIVSALSGKNIGNRSVARLIGVSERSIQRTLKKFDLPPPEFWRLLGRARRAAVLLKTDIGLADLACEAGFSDQAHMTRELVRWFGLPPARLRQERSLLVQIAQPGLGNWTGEQISNR